MPRGSFADIMREWQELLAGFDLNALDFPNLETERAELRTLITETSTASHQRSVTRSAFGQAIRDFEERLTRGMDVASRMRNGVRARYGVKDERLTQFGMAPFRRRPRTPRFPTPTPTEAAILAALKAEAAALAAANAVKMALAGEDATPESPGGTEPASS